MRVAHQSNAAKQAFNLISVHLHNGQTVEIKNELNMNRQTAWTCEKETERVRRVTTKQGLHGELRV